MATYDSGILGPFTGKLGTVVGTKWRGLYVMRSKGPSRRKNNAPLQMEQKARFALAAGFVRRMRNLFNVTFSSSGRDITARNKALAATITQSITGTYPGFSIDFSKVAVSRGSLDIQSNVTVSINAGILQWQWQMLTQVEGINGNDKAVLVAWCPELNYCINDTAGSTRASNAATLDVSSFTGKTVHTWLAFISENGSEVSDSVYTGQLTVE